jgi:hypothetical protein
VEYTHIVIVQQYRIIWNQLKSKFFIGEPAMKQWRILDCYAVQSLLAEVLQILECYAFRNQLQECRNTIFSTSISKRWICSQLFFIAATPDKRAKICAAKSHENKISLNAPQTILSSNGQAHASRMVQHGLLKYAATPSRQQGAGSSFSS